MVIVLSIIQNAKLYIKWISETVRLDDLSSASKTRKVYRGQVYWCYFGINIGSEQSEKRPCVILQNNKGNLSSSNTIVAPITHTKSSLPTVVPIADKFDSSGKKILDGNVLLSNIATVSKARLDSYITDLTTDEMKLVDEAIAKSIDIYTLILKYEKQISGQQTHINNLTATIKAKDEEIALLYKRIKELENRQDNSVDVK